MPATTPDKQLAEFLAKYTPEIAARAKKVLASMRRLVPGAVEIVYDNYNALAVGFGPTERASDAVVSIAVYPRWVTLFFLKGISLPDPSGVLKGSGSKVRHVVLEGEADLDRPAIRTLIAVATSRADPPFDAAAKRRIVIKSVSAKQRPRRPPASAGSRKRRD